MPPKPTCKVVKREGQRGARIDPKGCKVRTTKDAQGNKKKENKQGQQKIKRTTTKTDMRLAFAGSPQRHLIANWNDRPQNFRSNYKRNHNIVYDTGAKVTSAGQQLVCCAGLSTLGLGQALAGACGWQLHRAALNVFLFTERKPPPAAH